MCPDPARQVPDSGGNVFDDLGLPDAAERLGVDQPKVSTLMRFVTALDHDVIITIRPPKDSDYPGIRVLVEA